MLLVAGAVEAADLVVVAETAVGVAAMVNTDLAVVTGKTSEAKIKAEAVGNAALTMMRNDPSRGVGMMKTTMTKT